MGIKATVQLYLLMHAFESTFKKIIKEIHADLSDEEAILDDLFRMIKGGVLKDDKL